ncbi:MAG: MFS transporter [Opitutus sp.]|nr:MFS transporter [Opitutus sp.]
MTPTGPAESSGVAAGAVSSLSFGRDDQPESTRLRSAMLLVGTGYLFLTLCDYREGLANLALRYLLKDDLRLTATQLAGFFAITKLAWYCKPFAGLLVDNVRLFGTRRKGYLVAFSALAGGLWLALTFAHGTYTSMLGLVLAINVALMMVHTTLGGMLVEVGQTLRATGRISAVRSGVESFGWLLAGLVGGWIAARLLHRGFLINAALMFVLAALFAKLLMENRSGAPETGKSGVTLAHFKELFQHRTLWIAAGFWMLIKFSPGFGTPLFYFQTETLGFTPQKIGYLGFVSAAAGLLGSVGYMQICRRIALNKLLWLGVSLHAASSLAYFAYRSMGAAFAIEATYGLCTALAFMPIFDLLARATPKQFAALGYALIFSLGSLSVSGSDLIGSWIYERLGHSFAGMILLNSGTSAAVLLVIPFLPRALVVNRDGDKPAAVAE